MRSICPRWPGLVAIVGAALGSLSFPASAYAAEAPPASRYAELPGVKLWFTDTGSAGTPIVLLHANTGTSESWEAQAAAFARQGYRVIAFDRRGWGKSLADPTTGPQPGSVAGDLDALADHLRLDKFHLVGVAGGGFVSIDYAAWRPERLRSLVVAASTGQFAEQEMRDFTARVEIPELRKQAAVYREVGPSYRGANPEGTKRWIENRRACPAAWGACPTAAHAEYLRQTRRRHDAGPRHGGRRRSSRATGADARLGGAPEQVRMGHGAGFRPRDRLGASRCLQRDRSGVREAALRPS